MVEARASTLWVSGQSLGRSVAGAAGPFPAWEVINSPVCNNYQDHAQLPHCNELVTVQFIRVM